ncbi:cytochrome b/b6 domain-containing protein [soil metagenome]
MASKAEATVRAGGHRLWVRLTHWLIAVAVLLLLYTGFTILKAHPRLYWGDTGNDLTPALLEVPLGPNYRHGGWVAVTPFHAGAAGPVTASRTFAIYNQNSWARSLHFLAAWAFLAGLAAYLAIALATGHLRRALWPRRAELGRQNLWSDVRAHLWLPMPAALPGAPYNILQKLAYVLVVVVALPLMFLTGITMSPAIVASYPLLLDIFGGTQSARTIHFFTFTFLALFLLVHLAMIVLTGPVRQVRGMVLGK